MRNKVICPSMQTTAFSEAKIDFVNKGLLQLRTLGKKNIILLYNFFAALIEGCFQAMA